MFTFVLLVKHTRESVQCYPSADSFRTVLASRAIGILADSVRGQVFWDVTPCRMVKLPTFGETYYDHRQVFVSVRSFSLFSQQALSEVTCQSTWLPLYPSHLNLYQYITCSLNLAASTRRSFWTGGIHVSAKCMRCIFKTVLALTWRLSHKSRLTGELITVRV
jgi:hypothetical protein